MMTRKQPKPSLRQIGTAARALHFARSLPGLKSLRPLALLAIAAACFSSAQQPDAYLAAQRAYSESRFREAANLFGAAATADRVSSPTPTSNSKSHPDALLMQARSLAKLDDAAAAEAVLRRALEDDPHSSPALYLLGYMLQRENKPRESLEAFTHAAALATPRAEDLRMVALDYVLLDDYFDAIHWLQRALASDPGNAEAWYDLGRAEMNQGDFIESERDFKHTLELAPLHVKALNNLGLSYEAQNRNTDAIAAYTRAIAAQKGAAHPTEQPLLNYGALLNTEVRSAEAIEPLQQAVAIASTSSRCHEELSRAYAGTHQDALAREQMERAVALDPDNPRLHFQLGQMYRRAGLTERGQVELKRSAELYSTHSSRPEETTQK